MRLYAIAALGAAAAILLQLVPLGPRLATALGGVTIGATFAAMAWWVRANRAALDLADWCACASATVTVRMIVPHRRVHTPAGVTKRASPAEAALH